MPTPERKEGDGRLTLVVHVQRGRLYRVAPGGVEVSGNTSVPIEELRPFLKLSQGEPFVASKLGAMTARSRRSIKTRGFATRRRSTPASNEVGDGLVQAGRS